MDDKKLTRKQEVFCRAYISNGFNGAKAARDAGYSEKSACVIANENLSKPYISTRIEQMMKEQLESFGVGVEWRAKMLKQCAEGCLEGKGDRFGAINVSGIVEPIAMLNKMDGTTSDKQEIEVKNTIEKTTDTVNEYEKDF